MSTIDVWLDSQPDDPSDYEPEPEPEYARPSKRARLAELPVNMAEPPRRSQRRRSPRKGNDHRDPAAPATPPHSSSSSSFQHPHAATTPFLDDAETPRAAAITAVPVLQPPSSRVPVRPALARSPSSPSRSSASSWRSGANGRRQRSPVKHLSDLELSDVRVEAVTLELPGQAPPDVRGMCRDIRLVGRGNGLIPRAMMDHAAPLFADGLLDDLAFDDGADAEDEDQSAEHERFWNAANRLVVDANECEEQQLNEAEWNAEVHVPVLKLALSQNRSERRVWYRNITTAKIRDETLLPTAASGLATHSKMVDYAMVLDTRSDRALKERVRAKLRYEDLLAINHTPAECVRFEPLAVSIETKRSAIEEDAASVQLAVWVSAHFAWLQQLGREDCTPPTLPLVLVQGHLWKLMLAELGHDDNITIYRHVNLGTTKNILGVYQIVASLRRLARWVDETYRPWFEEEVLSIP